MNSIKVLAFDCDGVMFDTRKANAAYYNDLLAHLGRAPMTAEQFAYAQMHTVDESLALLFPDAEGRSAALRRRREIGYGPYLKLMEMEPDLIPLLSKYQGRLNIAVATNRTDTMNKVLAMHGIEKYFDLVVTALDVPRPKPHPDPLLRVLDRFRAEPAEMLYVGDSDLDAAAAAAAGVPFAAYGNPALDAAFHISRLGELDRILS